LRDAAADAVPATSSDVPLLECSASTDPMPFAATEPLLVVAFKPPAPVGLAEGAGFCTVVEADGAALEVALEVAAFETAAVDSVEPAKLAAPAVPVLETLPAD
jgi:hypothetical protein